MERRWGLTEGAAQEAKDGVREGWVLIGRVWSTTDWARGVQSRGGTPCRVAIPERCPYGANSAALPLAHLYYVGFLTARVAPRLTGRHWASLLAGRGGGATLFAVCGRGTDDTESGARQPFRVPVTQTSRYYSRNRLPIVLPQAVRSSFVPVTIGSGFWKLQRPGIRYLTLEPKFTKGYRLLLDSRAEV